MYLPYLYSLYILHVVLETIMKRYESYMYVRGTQIIIEFGIGIVFVIFIFIYNVIIVYM